MSERMTDEAFAFLSQQGYFDRQDIRRVFAEAKRARASEAQKDTVIKALADALEETLGAHLPGHTEHKVRETLRLAGRLP